VEQILGVIKSAVPIKVEDIHLAAWRVSRYCGLDPSEDQVRAHLEDIGMDAEVLLKALERLPVGKKRYFHKTVSWIRSVSRQLAGWVNTHHVPAGNLTKLNYVERELEKYRYQMEREIQERTAELIKANNRLQLEVRERDLAEEVADRKSRLMDAINHIFQHTLGEQSDSELAHAFLNRARRLVNSPFGFVAEQRQGQWQIVAMDRCEEAQGASASVLLPDQAEMGSVYRQLTTFGKPVAYPSMGDALQFEPVPTCLAQLNSFLVVPFGKDRRISGYIAVAEKDGSYTTVDRKDLEALSQAFVEALLRKRTEADKARSEKRLSLALDSANEGLWDYAPLSGQIYYSPRWFAMLGYDQGEFSNTLQTWSTLTHPDDLPHLHETLKMHSTAEREAFNIEIRMLSKSGQWHWLQVRGRTVESDGNGKAIRIVGTLIDVSKYKQVAAALQKANDELRRLAALDDLTQLANRRRFDSRLVQEWSRCQREENYLSVVMCDIDYFKHYNDTYGHPKGDETLYRVAQTISAALKRPTDLVARYGGEEFALILPNTDINGAQRVAEGVKVAIEALGLEHKTSKVHPYITLSFGAAAVIPAAGMTAKVLIEKADQALYKAKSKGRNRICCINNGKIR
jgi:diguanylate cyclase (GGDEF)-like protein/PAS domain S-box-containing protein